MENKFIILTPLYNVEKWIRLCMGSVLKQGYGNFKHYLIDDLSTDNTNQIIEKYGKKFDQINLITNKEKKYALKNIFDTLEELDLEDDDIVVILDGDDWLAHPNVLENLNKIYNEQSCWMTYGSYVEFPSNTKGKFSKQIPKEIVEASSYRESEWMSSHLRTFKYSLWKKLNKNDLINAETGKFIKAAWDLAFVFPMLEMCGNKALYVDEILYVYNRQNPLNEDKVDHKHQLGEEFYIRNKKKFERLQSL